MGISHYFRISHLFPKFPGGWVGVTMQHKELNSCALTGILKVSSLTIKQFYGCVDCLIENIHFRDIARFWSNVFTITQSSYRVFRTSRHQGY